MEDTQIKNLLSSIGTNPVIKQLITGFIDKIKPGNSEKKLESAEKFVESVNKFFLSIASKFNEADKPIGQETNDSSNTESRSDTKQQSIELPEINLDKISSVVKSASSFLSFLGQGLSSLDSLVKKSATDSSSK